MDRSSGSHQPLKISPQQELRAVMNKTLLFWLLAFFITAGAAIYQRMTGPTYPVSGLTPLHGRNISYRLERSHGGPADHVVEIHSGDNTLRGDLIWKRYKTDDPWTVVPMTNTGGVLSGSLPHQLPAGKLMYYVRLEVVGESAVVPPENPVVIRFKGDVPLPILITHVSLMFIGMFFSTRAGMEFFMRERRLERLTYWSLALLGVGGLILGPVVQKYAFDAYWTGWPFGPDLTDNKTAFIVLSWVVAAIALKKSRHPERWALAAAVITLGVYLIPHSLFGSELHYTSR
jgi:hypothetical protein